MADYANRGKILEEKIIKANEIYEKQGVAMVQKIATPTKVIRAYDPKIQKTKIVSAFHEKKSTVDFVGNLNGGSALAFDAKQTMNKTMLRLDAIEDHQFEYLKKFQEFGGRSFLIVEFTMSDEIFRIDFDIVIRRKETGKKGLLLADIRKECQICSQVGENPLHYLVNI